jgi:undecaprenyl-diphosphatase
VLVFRHTRSPWARGAAVAGAALMILLVGSSRLVLGAHHFSDVVAGVLVGAAWLALTTVTRTVLQR